MSAQHITEHSPASVAVLKLIGDNPGIVTSVLAERSGWSVFHLRNVLRFLRKRGLVKSERPGYECRWWLGQQQAEVRSTKPKCVAVNLKTASVFALGAA